MTHDTNTYFLEIYHIEHIILEKYKIIKNMTYVSL